MMTEVADWDEVAVYLSRQATGEHHPDPGPAAHQRGISGKLPLSPKDRGIV
jgi:hypothetical protein